MKISKIIPNSSLSVLLLAFAAHSASGVIITPTDALASTSLRSASPISSTIDGTGLTSTAGDVSTWTHAVNDPQANYWLSAQHVGTADITFTLGDTYNVDTFYFWQYTQGGGTDNRQIDSATLTFSTNGVDFTNSIDLTPAKVTLTAAYTPEVFTFSSVQNVTHIKLNAVNTDDYVGLAEVRFGGTAVPEPSAALLGGFALLALMVRRRR